MPRARDPMEVARLKGAVDKNPQRYTERSDLAHDLPIGEPPKGLTAFEKKVWREICSEAIPGVMQLSDMRVLTVTVRLVAEWELIEKHNRQVARKLKAWEKQLATLKQQFAEADDELERELIADELKAHRKEKPIKEYFPTSRIAQLKALFSEMAMTPAARQKVSVPEGRAADDDEFEAMH